MVWSRHHLPPNQILVNNHTIVYKAYTKHSYAMLLYQHSNGTKNHVNSCVHYLPTAFVSYRPRKGCKLKITYNLKLESARIKKISISHHRGFCKKKIHLTNARNERRNNKHASTSARPTTPVTWRYKHIGKCYKNNWTFKIDLKFYFTVTTPTFFHFWNPLPKLFNVADLGNF